MTHATMLRCALLAALCLITSCGTMFNQGPERITVDSEPREALVFLDDAAVGKTPTEVTLKRSAKGIIRIELDGYHPATYELKKEMNFWPVANAVFGLPGLLLLLIDTASDSTWHWTEKPITCKLVSGDAPEAPKPIKWPIFVPPPGSDDVEF